MKNLNAAKYSQSLVYYKRKVKDLPRVDHSIGKNKFSISERSFMVNSQRGAYVTTRMA